MRVRVRVRVRAAAARRAAARDSISRAISSSSRCELQAEIALG